MPFTAKYPLDDKREEPYVDKHRIRQTGYQDFARLNCSANANVTRHELIGLPHPELLQMAQTTSSVVPAKIVRKNR
jgi:hypothetical protein